MYEALFSVMQGTMLIAGKICAYLGQNTDLVYVMYDAIKMS